MALSANQIKAWEFRPIRGRAQSISFKTYFRGLQGDEIGGTVANFEKNEYWWKIDFAGKTLNRTKKYFQSKHEGILELSIQKYIASLISNDLPHD